MRMNRIGLRESEADMRKIGLMKTKMRMNGFSAASDKNDIKISEKPD